MESAPLAPAELLEFRAVLRGISPLIWRRFAIREDASIADLHDVLQIVFDWSDDHLHQFVIRGRRYGVYHEGGVTFSRDARAVCLREFAFRVREAFVYEYDFGDLWVHDIHLESRKPLPLGVSRLQIPKCIAGKNAAPPEGCGGPAAFLDKRSSYRLIARSESYEDVDGWVDVYIVADEDDWLRWHEYDPDRFDRNAVNKALSSWAAGEPRWRLL